MAPRGDIDVLVNLRAHNRDLLSGVAGSKAALKSLKAEQGKFTQGSREDLRVQRDRNRELSNQSRHLQALTLDYVATRKAMLSLGIRAAVTGFNSLTAAVEGAGQAAIGLAGSLGEASAAVGVFAAQGVGSGIQALGVLKLATKDVGKTLTLTGKQYETAFSKLTKPAQSFVKDLKGMRNEFQEIKMLAQKGMFPGFEAGLDRLKHRLPEIKQAVYDTAEVIGYLAKRTADEIDKNGSLLSRIAERNVRNLRVFGDTALNVGVAAANVFDGAGVSIDDMADKTLAWSKRLREDAAKLNQNNGWREFFQNAEQSAVSWTHTIGNTGKIGFEYLRAGQPVIDKMTRSIEAQTKSWADWSASQAGQDKMAATWKKLAPVTTEFSKAIGATIRNWAQMGAAGSENMTRIFRGYRTQLLPLIHDLGDSLNKNVLPVMIDLGHEVVDMWKNAKPGLKTASELIGGVGKGAVRLLGVVNTISDRLPGVTGDLAGLAIPFAVITGWSLFRLKISEAMLAMRQMVGLAPDLTQVAVATGFGGGGLAPGGGGGRRISAGLSSRVRGVSSAAVPNDVYTRARYDQMGGLTSRDRLTKRVSGAGYQRNPYATMAPGEGMGRVFTVDRQGKTRVRGTGRFASNYDYRDNVIMSGPNGAVAMQQVRPGAKPRLRKGYTVVRRERGAVGRIDRGGMVDARQTIREQGEGIASRSGRVQEYQRFQRSEGAHIDNPIQKLNRRQKLGDTAGSWARSAYEGSSSGLTKAVQKSKPIVKGMFAIGAISGLMSGVQSIGQRKSFKDILANTMSGLTLGLLPSADSGVEKNQQGVASLMNGAFSQNKDKRRNAYAGALDAGILSDAQKKAFKSGSLYEKNDIPKKIASMRGYLKELSSAGHISEQAFSASNKQLDKIASNFRGIKSIKNAFHIDIDSSAVTGNLAVIQQAFNGLRKGIPQDVDYISKRVKYNMRVISRNMDTESESGKQALAKNFQLGMRAVKRNIRDGVIGVKDGMRLIRRLTSQELQLYGYSAKQIKNYNAGRDTTGKQFPSSGGGAGTADPGSRVGAAHGAVLNAKSGLQTVGRRGDVGADKVALNAVVGRGEDVMVANRHQRKALDQRLADVGGVAGFFRGRWPKHTEPVYAARGFDSAGSGAVKPNFGSSPSNVKPQIAQLIGLMQSHFPLNVSSTTNHSTMTNSGNVSEHTTGNAVDLANTDFGIMNKASEWIKSSGLYKRIHQGIHNPNLAISNGAIQQPPGQYSGVWADHADHIHLSIQDGTSVKGFRPGSDSFAKQVAASIARIKTNVPGAFGQIIQGALDKARGAANNSLANIAGSISAGAGVNGTMSFKSVAKLAESVGLPGITFAQIAKGESGFNPRAVGHDPGGTRGLGLWQITTGFNDDIIKRFGGESAMFNPHTNAEAAKAIYDRAGIGAWYGTKYMTDPNAHYTGKQRGGLLTAARGLLSTTIPTQGGGVPAVSPGDAVGDDITEATRNKKAAAKKKAAADQKAKQKKSAAAKKKAAKYGKKRVSDSAVKQAIANSRRLHAHGYKKKLKKRPIRKSVKKWQKQLADGRWPGDPDFIDHLTGETKDSEFMGPFNFVRSLKGQIVKFQDQFDALQVEQTATDEFATVDLEGPEKIKGWLTGTLGWTGAQADQYVTQEGYDKRGSLEVPNPGGANSVDGKRGIAESVAEMKAQLGNMSLRYGNYGFQLLNMKELNFSKPIKERRDRLMEMKRVFDTNKKVMRKQKNKLQAGKNVGWEKQVKHNVDIIDALRDHLSASHRLPEDYQDRIKGEINDLGDLNKKLKDEKPAGTLGLAKAQQDYNVRAKEQEILTGDSTLSATWPGSGGLSFKALNSLDVWKGMQDYKTSTVSDAKTEILSLTTDMQDLTRQIEELTGTKVDVPLLSDLDDSAATDLANQLKDLQLSQATDKLRARDLEASQFGSLRDFAQNLGMRYVGSFAHGTTSVERTGMALVHKNETIVPDPQGPYKNGRTMTDLTSGGNGSGDVYLSVEGDLGGLFKLVDARVKVVSPDASSKRTGQKSRLIRATR